MKIYQIQDIKHQDGISSVLIEGSHRHVIKLDALKLSGRFRVRRTIDLPQKDAENLKIGQHIIVLTDKFSGFEDYVYIYNGKMYLNTKLQALEAHFCKMYIDNLPCFIDDYKLDRWIFKNVLKRECKRRNILVSKDAWENLQNVVMWDRFGRFIVDQR